MHLTNLTDLHSAPTIISQAPIISQAELLAAGPPAGYEQKGINCDCNLVKGKYVYQYYQTKRTPELCAAACTADSTCASFGFYTRDSSVQSWRGMCFLYGALCPDTDGHAATNTCPNPADSEAFVVNFNKLPTSAPTPSPTMLTDAPTSVPTPPPTPPTSAPTMEPGFPCVCEQPCGFFPLLDIDSDGCIVKAEAEKSESIKEKFEDMDTNKDGCVSKAECDAAAPAFDALDFPITSPGECDYGYYAPPKASVCIECIGGQTRRRRSDACTECPAGRVDVGEYDDCLGEIYLTENAEIGDTKLCLSGDKFESGITLILWQGITIATRNPDYYERAVVVGKGGFDDSARLAHDPSGLEQAAFRIEGNSSECKHIVLDHPLKQRFYKYDAVTPACNKQGGDELEDAKNYPCGCGRAICEKQYACHESCVGKGAQGTATQIEGADSGISYGDSGCCVGPINKPAPTPVPTVSAVGDPHLVNLQGEHFDINHEGEFTLLRLPQAANKAAEVLLRATIAPEHGKPCTTYITEVEFSGLWFGGKSVQVRSYLRTHDKNGTDKFLGVRVLEGGLEAPWQNITDWAEGSMVLSSPKGPSGFEVSLSKQSWSSKKKSARRGAPTMAGQFTITFRSQKQRQEDATRIVVRQDIPAQEHLNLAVRKLGKLGRLDVGGLLGFDSHPESLEEVTHECERHRMGLDHEKGPKSQPAWKTRWSKIKAGHNKSHSPGEDMNDNEAAASLVDKMCACDSYQEPDGGEEMAETDGIIVDFQTARLAEASWE